MCFKPCDWKRGLGARRSDCMHLVLRLVAGELFHMFVFCAVLSLGLLFIKLLIQLGISFFWTGRRATLPLLLAEVELMIFSALHKLPVVPDEARPPRWPAMS